MAKPEKNDNSMMQYNKCSVAGLRLAIAQSVAIDWPLLITGSFGIGKSQIVNSWLEKSGYVTADFRVSQMLPEDAGGLPYANVSKKAVERLMPDIISKCHALHEETGKPVGVFLDEFTSGVPSIMAAMYSFVLERQAAGFHLPEGTKLILAGNTSKDRGVVYEMPRPMANRVMIVEFTGPTWDEFEQYGHSTGVHPAVMTFLKHQPNYLCNQVNVDEESGRNPTPRSWVAVSSMLHAADSANHALADRMFLAAAIVGDHAALQFEATMRLQEKLVSFEEIVADPKGAKVFPEDLAASYMQITMLLARISSADAKKDGGKLFDKVFTYVERMPRELIGVFLKQLLRINPRLLLSKREIAVKYHEFCSAGNLHAA